MMFAAAFIIVPFILLAIVLISTGSEQKKQGKKQKQIENEQARIRREFRQQQEEARQTVLRQIEIERQTMKLAAEQAKQAEMLQKHEEKLRKHEEEIKKLKVRMDQAENDIAFLREKAQRINNLCKYEELERDACIPYGKEYRKYEKKLITLESQFRAAEKQLEKAVATRDAAKEKLEVA